MLYFFFFHHDPAPGTGVEVSIRILLGHHARAMGDTDVPAAESYIHGPMGAKCLVLWNVHRPFFSLLLHVCIIDTSHDSIQFNHTYDVWL